MIDEMFQEGTDRVLDDRVARPLQGPTVRPSFGLSVWNTMKAPVKGVVAGANESIAMGADILGAFGNIQAGIGLQADPSQIFSSEAREKRIADGEKARKDLQSGEAFSTDLGDGLRARSRDLMPDAATSNAAEDILFGASRFMSKAVGYSVMAGPVPGAVLTGIDEGMTEADKLKGQGVDINTRTKVGMVAGSTAAAAVALPIAGKTVAGTAALVVAGGPASFIAQQAASRSILANAGYDKISDQYDPFDPVGLAVSTLVPAAFGAYALRGVKIQPKPVADPAAARALADMGGNERLALKYDDARLDAYAVTAAQREGIPAEALLAIKNVGEKSGPTAVSPKGARGVMQFMPETWAAYGKGDPRDPIASIDAGARFMKDLINQYGGDVRAAIAHYNGGGKAGKAVKEGGLAPALETRKYLARTDAYLAERQGTEAGKALASDPEAVAAARVAQVRSTVESWNLKGPADVAGAEQHLSAILRASDQLGAGQAVSVARDIPLDDLSRTRLLDNMVTRLETAKADLLPEAGNLLDAGTVRTMRDELTMLKQERAGLTDEAIKARAKEVQQTEGISYKQALSAAKKELNGRLQDADSRINRLESQMEANRVAEESNKQIAQLDSQIAQVKQDRSAVDAPTPKTMALAVKQAVNDIAPPARTASETPIPASKVEVTATKAPETASGAAQGAKQAAGEANPAAAAMDAQAAEIARLSPDMMVQLEGMDKPMRLADALEAVKAEAAKDVEDAPLLQAAAECFLRS